ncbi:hypothetical protein [Mucilaginibacter sp.]
MPNYSAFNVAIQAEHVRNAQILYFEQIKKAKRTKLPEDFNAAKKTLDLSKMLEKSFDETLKDVLGLCMPDTLEQQHQEDGIIENLVYDLEDLETNDMIGWVNFIKSKYLVARRPGINEQVFPGERKMNHVSVSKDLVFAKIFNYPTGQLLVTKEYDLKRDENLLTMRTDVGGLIVSKALCYAGTNRAIDNEFEKFDNVSALWMYEQLYAIGTDMQGKEQANG